MKNSLFISWIISGSKSFRSWLVSLGENVAECCQQLYPWQKSRSTSVHCLFLSGSFFCLYVCVTGSGKTTHSWIQEIARTFLEIKFFTKRKRYKSMLSISCCTTYQQVGKLWVDFSSLKPLCKITQKSSAKTSVSVTGPLRVVYLITRPVGDLNMPQRSLEPCDVIVKKPGHPVTP